MERASKIDLSALQDGNLHLIAFLGDKFSYLTVDPNGSQWLVENALSGQFPSIVRKMLAESETLK